MILTADLHLRMSVPRCRKETEEEWLRVQEDTLKFIASFKDDIVIAGDIFHKPISNTQLSTIFLSSFLNRKYGAFIMPGNHDVVEGSFEDIKKSSYGTIQSAIQLEGCLQEIEDSSRSYVLPGTEVIHGKDTDILFMHQLVYRSEGDIPPGATGITARNLLKKYPEYRIICVGDNHQHFMYEKGDRVVLSPGCVTKQDVSFKDTVLKMFHIDNDCRINSISEIELPDRGELVDDSYIISQREREGRMETYVEALEKMDTDFSLDFRKNAWQTKSMLSPEAVNLLSELLPEHV
jgi:DNA repair exonuclease SbcCD nuclease subunit